MKNEFQDIESIIPSVQRAFVKNPRRSISAQFRKARNSSRYTLIGCYPILATIIHTALSIGIYFSKNKVFHAIKQSDELKSFSKGDKKSFAHHLLSPTSVVLKQDKCAYNFNDVQDNDTLPVATLKNHGT